MAGRHCRCRGSDSHGSGNRARGRGKLLLNHEGVDVDSKDSYGRTWVC
jgi:hypothetical protein